MEPINQNNNSAPEPELSPGEKTAAIWLVVSFGFAILIHTYNNSYMVMHAGFFTKCFSVLVATVLGTIGALIGNGIRKLAAPDSFFTTGGIGSILKAKLFWAIGPQLIGMAIGVFLGATLVLK